MQVSSLNRFSVVEALNVRESSQWKGYINNGNQYQQSGMLNNNIDVSQFSKVLFVVSDNWTEGSGNEYTVGFSIDPTAVYSDDYNAGTEGHTTKWRKIIRLSAGIHILSIPKFVNNKTYMGVANSQWYQIMLFM